MIFEAAAARPIASMTRLAHSQSAVTAFRRCRASSPASVCCSGDVRDDRGDRANAAPRADERAARRMAASFHAARRTHAGVVTRTQ